MFMYYYLLIPSEYISNRDFASCWTTLHFLKCATTMWLKKMPPWIIIKHICFSNYFCRSEVIEMFLIIFRCRTLSSSVIIKYSRRFSNIFVVVLIIDCFLLMEHLIVFNSLPLISRFSINLSVYFYFLWFG